MPRMFRESDGQGDSGAMSQAIWVEGEDIKIEESARPRVGVRMRVGSVTARSYSSQDWWMTTEITEILEETETKVRFKTGNSIYIWEI